MPDTDEAAVQAADAPQDSTQPHEGAAPAGDTPPRAPAIPEHLLDPDALKVVRRLRRNGFKAFLVGGCVRDLLLGLRPKDFDVATSAHPHEVKKTFGNSRPIGRRFRLVHVYFRDRKVIEVSTFRSNPLDVIVDEAELKQDLLIRHDNVFGTEEEDARRRDFTINGLFYDLDEGKVVDYVGGMVDLQARSVRTIGNPDVRMREDPVRILRAIRFAAKCNLSFDADTLAAMKAHAQEIPRCAPPRVLEELLKLTRSGAAKRCIELMQEVGVLKILLAPLHAVFSAHPEALEKQLKALEALDEHVRNDEVPSDAVLLSALLSPLPRSGSMGPIAKAPPFPPRKRDGAVAQDEPGEAGEIEPAEAAVAEQEDDLDPELEALNAALADDGAADDGDDDEGDDEGDAEGAEVLTDPAAVAEGFVATETSESSEASVDREANEAAAAMPEHLTAAQADAVVHAPLPSAALRSLNELHDERLAAQGIPTFSTGGESAPWSLPKGIVPPDTVLSELVRTARLPRRIAERSRLILSVQAILAGDKKKRKFSPAQFARESIFPEALAIFELNAAATGEGVEALARWQAIFLGQPVGELQVDPPRDAERTRRRRRGGRGRRGGKS
jgi:hypothetical protein